MRRREFIALLGGTAIAWPLRARAQQPTMPVIGFINGQAAASFQYLVAGFQRGLNEQGFVEGQNVTIEYRWANGHPDLLPELVADIVRHKPAVIVATGGAHIAAIAAIQNNSNRRLLRRRSREAGLRRQPQSPRWKCDGR